MIKKLTHEKIDLILGSSGTRLVIQGKLNELLDELGQPSSIGSGDDKVVFHWAFCNNSNKIITVYDYKSKDDNIPAYEVNEWHIGSKGLMENEVIEFFENYNLTIAQLDATTLPVKRIRILN